MPEPDYYQVLGVSRDATAQQVHEAYKKLARKYHPDVNPEDPQSAEKFKQVQQAYEVLRDPDKRAQYDRFGPEFREAQRGAGPQGRTYRWTGGAGPQEAPPEMEELFRQFGFDFGLGGAFGGGAPFGGARQAVRPRKGRNVRAETTVPFAVAAEGGSHEVGVQRDGRVERLSVKILPGLEPGQVIRLAGQGEPGQQGGPAGDLLLTVHVAPHRWFRREGNHLLLEVPVTPAEAALGAKVEVPTLSEGHMIVTVPPGTSSGAKLRLRGKGLPDPKTRQRGDQLIVVKIVVPKQLDEASRQLYQQLGQTSSHAPRANLW